MKEGETVNLAQSKGVKTLSASSSIDYISWKKKSLVLQRIRCQTFSTTNLFFPTDDINLF